MTKPTSLSDLLPGAIERAGVQDTQLTASHVCELFSTLLKEHPTLGQAAIRPISFKYGLLTLEINGSALASEFLLHQHRLRHALNRRLKKELVKRIRYRLR